MRVPLPSLPPLFLSLVLAGPARPQNTVPRPEMAQCQRTLQADPWRLDIRLRLADLYQAAGEFEAEYSLWARTLQMADQGYRRLRWERDGPLPQRSSHLIPPRLEDAIGHYVDLGTREGTERALRLSKLAVTFYPDHLEFHRARALCYARRGDPTTALKVLLRSLRKDPKDGATLSAIGDTLWDAGKRKEARVYYRKALDLGRRGPWMERARRRQGGTGDD